MIIEDTVFSMQMTPHSEGVKFCGRPGGVCAAQMEPPSHLAANTTTALHKTGQKQS